MKAAIFVIALAAALGFWWLWSAGAAARHLTISEATAMPMGAGVMVTLTIDNTGAPDMIVGATNGRVMGGPLPVPTGSASLALEAGHVFVPLGTLPEEGALIPLALEFAEAGTVDVKARLTGTMMQHAMGDTVPLVGVSALDIQAATVGTGVEVTVSAPGFTFSQDQVDGPHVDGVGHGHLYVGGTKIGRIYGPTARIGRLPPGEHRIWVSLNTNDHQAYAMAGVPAVAETTIAVD